MTFEKKVLLRRKFLVRDISFATVFAKKSILNVIFKHSLIEP